MYSIDLESWPVVWVAGNAGWFEVIPAPKYEAMYDTVCEGITLYYHLMDTYKEAKDQAKKSKKGRALQMPIEKLLFEVWFPHKTDIIPMLILGGKYAVLVGDGVTLSEAKERCQQHAQFLLAHFSKDPNLDWNATSFKKWLAGENEV